MTKVEVINELDALHAYKEAWSTLRKNTSAESVSFQQFIQTISDNCDIKEPVVLLIREDDKVVAILPLAIFAQPKKYVIGEFRIFSIQHRVLHIVNSVIGSLNSPQAEAVINHLSARKDVDAINLYELHTNSSLYKAVVENTRNIRSSPSLGDSFPHWITDFPGSFEAYFASFSSKTRNSLKRKLKKLRVSHQLELEKIIHEEQVDTFLKQGELISRETYQWNLGARLVCDHKTIESFKLSARQEELRCYLLFADQIPIAFLRGQIINGVFYYGTPGFLREYSKWSPGTIILLMVLEDLIDNTPCRCFDFGMGGDFTGYKSLFGNRTYDAAIVEFYPCKTLKSKLLYSLDWLFWAFKQVLKKFISPQLKSSIKNALRRVKVLK